MTVNRKKLTIIASSLYMIIPQYAFAQPKPEVIVKGKRPDVINKIDRRIYNIKDDPDFQTGNATDILRHLPSIIIDNYGNIELRGKQGVKILINGQAPIDGQNALSTIRANQIDRIEVITNPSAEFAADSNEGIINIITKKKSPTGISGNINNVIDTNQTGTTSASADFKSGKYTLSLSAGANNNLWDYKFNGVQEVKNGNNVVEYVTNSNADSKGLNPYYWVALRRQNTKHNRIELNGGHFANKYVGNDFANAFSSPINADALHNLKSNQRTQNNYSHSVIGFEDNYENPEIGRSFKIGGYHSYGETNNIVEKLVSFTNGQITASKYFATNDFKYTGLNFNFSQSFKKGEILSFGAEYGTNNSHSSQQRLIPIGIELNPGGKFFDKLDEEDSKYALFTTYQFNIKKIQLQPGLRYESNKLNDKFISSNIARTQGDFFPSLNMVKNIGSKAKLHLSYTKKVIRPSGNLLNPTPIYRGLYYVQTGNPNLKPIYTNSYEISYEFQKQNFNYGISLYSRQDSSSFGSAFSYDNKGILHDDRINAGGKSQSGTEITIRGKFKPKLKYTLDLNLYYDNHLVSDGILSKHKNDFSYSTNGTLEFDCSKSDKLLISLEMKSANIQFQSKSSENGHVDISYSRQISDRFDINVSINNIYFSPDSKKIILAKDFKEVTVFSNPQTALKLSLNYKFGAIN